MFLKLCYLRIFSFYINNLNLDNMTTWFSMFYQIKTAASNSLNLGRIAQQFKSRALLGSK